MNIIFNATAASLELISWITGLTYKEINVIVYYFLIPFIYVVLLDKICRKHFFKATFLAVFFIFLLFLKNFRVFAERLFDRSVEFLLGFKLIGWDYVTASVIVCVVIPAAIFFILFYYANRHKSRNGAGQSVKETQVFFIVCILLVLASIKSAGLCILLFGIPPFLIFIYGIILIWGLLLWRRLYLNGRKNTAFAVLTINIVIIVLWCVKSVLSVFLAIGAAGINP